MRSEVNIQNISARGVELLVERERLIRWRLRSGVVGETGNWELGGDGIGSSTGENASS